MDKTKPTFIRAAIMDWKYMRISTGRLFELLRVPYYEAYHKLLDEQKRTGKWFAISANRIEELLMTTELLTIKAKQDLQELNKYPPLNNPPPIPSRDLIYILYIYKGIEGSYSIKLQKVTELSYRLFNI